MVTDLRLLITRSEPGASRMAAELAQAGYTSVSNPLLRAAATGIACPVEPGSTGDECIASVIFVSEHAVLHAGDLFRQLADTVRWYAIGPATSKALGVALAAADVKAPVVQPRLARSEGLLAEPSLQNIAETTILLVAGEGGRALLADTLRDRGARILLWPVYRREPLLESDAMQANLSEIDACIASSGDGLKLLTRQWFAAGGGAGVPVCVPSPRVAELARAEGWQNVICSAGADAPATIEALRAFDFQEQHKQENHR